VEAQKVVTVSQVIQKKNGFTMQVGLPFLGNIGTENTCHRHPFSWDVLYLNGTFLKSTRGI
jgi:hypothetical protein